MSEHALPVTLLVDDLILDTENPRLVDSVPDDRAAIFGLLRDQKDKLVALAQHIAKHSMSPIELNLVYPVEGGKYVVAEGNRRTAALKILRNPAIIHGTDPKLVKQIIAIAKNAVSLPTTMLCIVMQSEADRIMWVKLRHTGLNGGRGLSEWSAKEQARFMVRHNQDRTTRMEFGLHVVQLVEARCALSNAERAALKVIPITTLERMLGDPVVRQALGIERSSDGVRIVVDDEEKVIAALKSLVMDIALKRVKVGQLMSKEQRAERVEGWQETRKPGVTSEPATPRLIRLNASTHPVVNTPTHPNPNLPDSIPPAARYSMPRSPDDRKTLIPTSTTLKITDPKVRRIFIELKKLQVEGFENAVSVLLRVFLELSIESLLTLNSVPYFDHDKLRKKMEKVADYWESNQIMARGETTAWRSAAGSYDLFSIHVLHSYVHAAQAIPKRRELIRTWDSMETYFKNLWPS